VGSKDVVFIVSSDPSSRQLAGGRFKKAGFATAELETGEDALASAGDADPVLVILDLDLSDMSGYMAFHELRDQLGDALPIILISGDRTESSDRVAGLLIGGDDYMTKPFDPDELLVRAQRLVSKRISMHAPDGTLTAREVQILQLLAAGKSQQRIAKDLFISAKTVGTHIQRVLTKLGVHSRAEAVALAYRSGLIDGKPARSERPSATRDDPIGV
jgi:two-component system, NarL family, nitrate/nitrite response regulator NarL